MQYFFTNKEELMLHHGDAFTWTIPLISKSMKEMCLNLVEFTNNEQFQDELDNAEEDKEFQEIMQIVGSELNFTGKISNC
jgi:mannitol/fructose-specific phosphotransferase system IIA component (Ntr-type)